MHLRVSGIAWLVLAALLLVACGDSKKGSQESSTPSAGGQAEAGGAQAAAGDSGSNAGATGAANASDTNTAGSQADADEGDADPDVQKTPTPNPDDVDTPVPASEGNTPTPDKPDSPTPTPDGSTPQEAPTPGPTPGASVEVQPFVFDPPLPTTAIGTVDGDPVPATRMLEMVLEQNFNSGVGNLVMGKIMELELISEGLEVTDADVEAELREMIERSSPGKTLEEVLASGQTSAKSLRDSARTQRGWKILFWKKQNIPEDQRGNEANPFLMRFFMQQAMQKFERRIRGANPAPDLPYVAQVIDRSSGGQIVVTANEALDLLMGLVKQSALVDLQRQVLEDEVLRRAMQKKGVEVSESEVATWAMAMQAKHQPPFTWDQVCRLKGTTVEREKQRWKRIQAWKRMTDADVQDADIESFLQANKGFFLGHNKKISHILVRTADEVSGLSLGEEAEAAAKEKIDTLYAKAIEGLDFGWLAKTYSDDAVTARGDGRLAQGVKAWGGALDPAFQKAAWALKQNGEISQPIKSQFGWHIIRLEDYDRTNKNEPDWKNPRYWEWVTDEFETKQMEAWFANLIDSANLVPASKEVVFGLKEATFK